MVPKGYKLKICISLIQSTAGSWHCCFRRSTGKKVWILWPELKTCLHFHWWYNYKPSSCLKCSRVFWNFSCKDSWNINLYGTRGILDMKTIQKKIIRKLISHKTSKNGFHSSCLCKTSKVFANSCYYLTTLHFYFQQMLCLSIMKLFLRYFSCWLKKTKNFWL